MPRSIVHLLLLFMISLGVANAHGADVEQWGVFELTLKGPQDGNPFVNTTLHAQFRQGQRVFEPAGFYDGQGLYRVRFMPDAPGKWNYVTRSNVKKLDGRKGSFKCVKASAGNHGPVHVANTRYFAYADGTPFWVVGTTCYAWVHQGDALEEQTLKTLASAPFNKLRMCVFPKRYVWNQNEPVLYPYEGTPPNQWDFTRFNPAFFQHLEKRIAQLRDLGIEADLILFHPYDEGHWGFDRMDPASDDRYLRYVVARFSAYRNVWWSMANEWDLLNKKKDGDWDRFFQIVQQSDPYQHLRSIHNCARWYDHKKPWVTHVSAQAWGYPVAWRNEYQKPLIFDEMLYEGNIQHDFGNITAQDMVNRFWMATVWGAYGGHGETYMHPQDILWWSKGGVLHGESPARLTFMKKILADAPVNELEPIDYWTCGKPGEYYLLYVGERQPAQRELNLPAGVRFKAELIDVWNMTITPMQGEFQGKCMIPLPGKPYQAVRLKKL